LTGLYGDGVRARLVAAGGIVGPVGFVATAIANGRVRRVTPEP
jgi:hypothetical protein